MLYIAICDDDEAYAAQIKLIVQRIVGGESSRIEVFCSAAALYSSVREGSLPNILLIDIDLGNENGIKLVKQLFLDKPDVQIIYITAFVDFCTEVYETEHTYFLRKPISEEQMRKALEKAYARLADTAKSIAFSTRTETAQFPLRDIVYIESHYRTIDVYTASGKHEYYSNIEETAKKVDGRFVQCHKSFLVNLQHVKAMERVCFIMDSGANVPISRGMRQRTRDIFFKYLGGEK